MKNLFSPARILLALALGYAIWFALFIPDFTGNLRWAYCLVMGVQLALACVYGYLLVKKTVQPVLAWGTVVLWAFGSAFVAYYESRYFFDDRAAKPLETMMQFLMGRPSVPEILGNSSHLPYNALVQAGAGILLVVGLLLGGQRPKNTL